MRTSVMIGLLIAQAIGGFFLWPNPVLPGPNMISAVLILLVPALALITLLAALSESLGKCLLYSGLSGMLLFGFNIVYFSPTYVSQPFMVYLRTTLMLLEVSLLTLIPGLGFWFLYRISRWSLILSVPLLYSAAEFLRIVVSPALFFIPNPVGMVAECLTGNPVLIQIASFTGMAGVNFLIIYCNSLLALGTWEWLLHRPQWRQRLGIPESSEPMQAPARRQAVLTAMVVGGFLAVLLLAGNYEALAVSKEQAKSAQKIRPAMLQSGVDMTSIKKQTSAMQDSIAMSYRRQILEAARQQADFVVFPDSALPFSLPAGKRAWDSMMDILREAKISALMSVDTVIQDNQTVYSTYQVDKTGKIQAYYVKQQMLPFENYLPMQGVLEGVLHSFNYLSLKTHEILKLSPITLSAGNLVSGRQKNNVFTMGKNKIFVLLSGEWQYPRYAREGANLGAEAGIFPAPSDWMATPLYFNSRMEELILRAVETRRWIGCTTNRISAWVDALGIVRFQTKDKTRQVLVESIPCLTRQTFYTRFGDVFGWLSVVGSLCLVGLAAWKHFGYNRQLSRGA